MNISHPKYAIPTQREATCYPCAAAWGYIMAGTVIIIAGAVHVVCESWDFFEVMLRLLVESL